MQPDYLVLAEEPEGEAKYTGQQNVLNAPDAATMISGEIALVQPLALPTKLGADFGTWTMPPDASTLSTYANEYANIPGLDYVDFHLYPINTENNVRFIDNNLLIASVASSAGKPVAMSEGWAWKMENSEWNVEDGDFYRGRDPFSFWAPLDSYYLKTIQALGQYANMLYVAPENPDYLFVYQHRRKRTKGLEVCWRSTGCTRPAANWPSNSARIRRRRSMICWGLRKVRSTTGVYTAGQKTEVRITAQQRASGRLLFRLLTSVFFLSLPPEPMHRRHRDPRHVSDQQYSC